MKSKTSLPAVFISPSMIVLAVLAFVPTVFAINIAFQDRQLSNEDSHYVGLANFIALFSDRRFLNSIVVSLDLGSHDGHRYDVRRGPARHPHVRGDVGPRPQHPVGAVPDPGADAAGVGRVRLEVRLPSAVRPGRLSLPGDHRAAARPPGQPIDRARDRRLRRCLAVVAVLLGDHPASARKPAAGAARGRRARSCAELGALRLCRAADAQGPARSASPSSR